MIKFYIVPEEVALANDGRINEAGVGIKFIQDLQGRWVINTGVAKDFPELDLPQYPVVELSKQDFPTFDNE